MSYAPATEPPITLGGRSLGRAVLYTGFGDFASKAAVLATTLIAARALPPVEFSAFVGFSALAVFAATIWDFGFSAIVTREVAAKRASASTAMRAAARTRLRTLALPIAIFLIGSVILGSIGALSIVAVASFAAAALLFATSIVPLAILRAELRFHVASVSQSGGRWVTVAVAALALLWVRPAHALPTIALAVASGEAATLMLAAAFLWHRPPPPVAAPAQATALTVRAALPFAAAGLLSAAYNRLDVIIVAALTSADQVSAYAPASRIQDVLYALPSMMGVVMFPVIARTWNHSDGPRHTRTIILRFMLAGLAVAVPVSAGAAFFAPEVIELALGANYAAAVTPTRILIWFLPLAVIQAPLIAGLGASGRAGDVIWIFAVTFAAAMAMHVALVPAFGASGAALASLSRDLVAVSITVALAVRAGAFALPAVPWSSRSAIGRNG